jgi:hypothetical protein
LIPELKKKSPTIQEGESGATGFYGFLGGKNEELCSVGSYLTFLVRYVKRKNTQQGFPKMDDTKKMVLLLGMIMFHDRMNSESGNFEDIDDHKALVEEILRRIS